MAGKDARRNISRAADAPQKSPGLIPGFAKIVRNRFTGGVFKEWLFGRKPPAPALATPPADFLPVGNRHLPLRLVRHHRARRYLLRLLPDATIRLTVPRGGSIGEARRFALSQTAWLEQQLEKLAYRPQRSPGWVVGTAVLFLGSLQPIQAGELGAVRLDTQLIKVGDATDLRPPIEKHLHQLAARELPPRVWELAKLHGLTVQRVTVRNQKSRWGSCSRRGTISLNWRLIQTPELVRDYIILHELMHLRQMNHSNRFWQEVAGVCPNYPAAEQWLKEHARLLRA